MDKSLWLQSFLNSHHHGQVRVWGGFPFFRGVQVSKAVCALCSTCSDVLGPVPSMCWQSPDSLSYNVGMGPVDSGFRMVETGSGHHGFWSRSQSCRATSGMAVAPLGRTWRWPLWSLNLGSRALQQLQSEIAAQQPLHSIAAVLTPHANPFLRPSRLRARTVVSSSCRMRLLH